MAAIEIGWTPGLLRDVTVALRTTLDRVPESSVRDTGIAPIWQRATDWLKVAEPLAVLPDDALPLDHVPPFPLTNKELQALRASLDGLAVARAAATSTHPGVTHLHVHHSLRRVTASANWLLVAILACCLVDVFDALFLGAHPAFSLSLCGLSTAVALGLGIIHLRRLGHHAATIEATHAIHNSLL